MRHPIAIGFLLLAAACGSSSPRPKTTAKAAPPPAAPAKLAKAEPPPVPAEPPPAEPASPAATKPDPHALFQAAAATGDVGIMTRINQDLGLADENGVPKESFNAFIDGHLKWATDNSQWIVDNGSDPANALAWLRANYDPDLALAAPFSEQESDDHKLFQAAAITADDALFTRVTFKLGLSDQAGVESDKMAPFMARHGNWAVLNEAWFKGNVEDAKQGAAYIRKHFDKKYKLPKK